MTYDPPHGEHVDDSEYDHPAKHRPSNEAWKALARIDKHEAVCAERYNHIASRLDQLSADQMTNRYVMFALILAVVGSLLTAVLTLEDPESYRVGEIEKSADPIFNLYPRAETPIHIEPPR